MTSVRYTNLPGNINDNRSTESKTRRFFNGFFEEDIAVSDNEWDAVHGFFLGVTDSPEAAAALSEAIITSSRQQKVSSIDLIQEFSKFSGLELDNVLALFFNSTRRNTSLLGFNQNRSPNQYVSRNVLI